jgi:hypothetical protein
MWDITEAGSELPNHFIAEAKGVGASGIYTGEMGEQGGLHAVRTFLCTCFGINYLGGEYK